VLTEDDKAVAVAASELQGPSAFVGVSWNKRGRKWTARIQNEGKSQNLGSFDDEHEAARAVDTASRRLFGDDAHGGRAGRNWHRLNFPTESEVKRAQERGALLTEEDQVAAVAASERQGPSDFVGVSWAKRDRKWIAHLRNDGKQQCLGRFVDEQEAAHAVGTVARQLRGEDAHGGRSGVKWLRLNFPTEAEVKRAQERGALLTKEDKAAAIAASELQGPSKFVSVSWHKRHRKWTTQWEESAPAARAVDTAARRLRGEGAHGGRAGRKWLRLNFPSKREAGRAKALGMPAAR
jgi:hypothetical protein